MYVQTIHQAFTNSGGEDYVLISEYSEDSTSYQPLGQSNTTQITGSDGQEDVVLVSARSVDQLFGETTAVGGGRGVAGYVHIVYNEIAREQEFIIYLEIMLVNTLRLLCTEQAIGGDGRLIARGPSEQNRVKSVKQLLVFSTV